MSMFEWLAIALLAVCALCVAANYRMHVRGKKYRQSPLPPPPVKK